VATKLGNPDAAGVLDPMVSEGKWHHHSIAKVGVVTVKDNRASSQNKLTSVSLGSYVDHGVFRSEIVRKSTKC
jgi:hypothetical protein